MTYLVATIVTTAVINYEVTRIAVRHIKRIRNV